MNKSLTIGFLAKQAGVSIETVRYYQRIGLIIEPSKPLSGYRIYALHDVEQIQFIKRAQQLGFSLLEIADLLKISKGKCSDVRQKAEIKRDKIAAQIDDLQSLHKTLSDLIKTCELDNNNDNCPIVTSLVNH